MSQLYAEKRKNGKSHDEAFTEVGRLAEYKAQQQQKETENKQKIASVIDEKQFRNNWMHNMMKKKITSTLEKKEFSLPETTKENKEEVKRRVAELLANKARFEEDCLNYHATTGADMDNDEFQSHLSVATMKTVELYMESQHNREVNRLLGTMKNPLTIDEDEYTREKDASLYQMDSETKKEANKRWDESKMIYPKLAENA